MILLNERTVPALCPIFNLQQSASPSGNNSKVQLARRTVESAKRSHINDTKEASLFSASAEVPFQCQAPLKGAGFNMLSHGNRYQSLTLMRSRLTSLRSRSATASTASTHISAMSRLHLPTLQAQHARVHETLRQCDA